MTELVLIDNAGTLADLLAERLHDQGRGAVALTTPEQALDEARKRHQEPPDAVIVDPEVWAGATSGLDSAVHFLRWCPESCLVFFVQTDANGRPSPVVRTAWDALRPRTAVAKSSPLNLLLATLEAVVDGRAAEVDPCLRPWLTTAHVPGGEGPPLARFVRHGGHAKLWRALLAFDEPPSYRQVADHGHLSVNTVRAYRDDLLDALGSAGLARPTMADMHHFAHGVRPLLAPLIKG
ncbi:MAG: hypothetical protein ACFCVK_14650 [Acidimicrobiales bacterium]